MSTSQKPNRHAVIVINTKDNVATALIDLEKGISLQVEIGDNKMNVTPRNPIPFGHKLALKKISKGDNIIKYGEVIGKATRDIEVGEHVHVHNVESNRGRGDLQ